VDYGAILAAAEGEADIILWDGGNNDFSFYRPDLDIVVADPLRPSDGLRHHPGETNLRMADVIVINKVDSATPEQLAAVRSDLAAVNPDAPVVLARSSLRLDGGEIAGRSVVVVEDGPTLTHGGMAFGAGVVAAGRFGASELIDPRPYAVGSIAEVLSRYPALGHLVPAMGYGPEQVADLRATLEATPADIVLAATPIDLATVLHLDKPVVRVRYDLEEVEGPRLADLIGPILLRARPYAMEI
jgi:predicted GTPase